MKTQIIRDTDYSFLRTTTRKDGSSFTRKIEKGSSEYANACILFRQRGAEIAIKSEINF